MNVNSHVECLAISGTNYKLTEAQIGRLKTAKAEAARLDQLLEDINGIRDVFDDAGRKFASGEIDMIEASVILGNSIDRVGLTNKLRTPVKAALRDVVEGVADIVENSRTQEIADILDRCKTLEASERAGQAQAGIEADLYQPSGLLIRLRETHRRAVGLARERPNRASLKALVDAVEGVAKAAPEPLAIEALV